MRKWSCQRLNSSEESRGGTVEPHSMMADGSLQELGGRPQAQHQRKEEAEKDWWSRVRMGIHGSAHPEGGMWTIRLSNSELFFLCSVPWPPASCPIISPDTSTTPIPPVFPPTAPKLELKTQCNPVNAVFHAAALHLQSNVGGSDERS